MWGGSWGGTPRNNSANNAISDFINKLKEYDYWKIFSRLAVGTIVMYILKVMKDVPG